METFSLFVLSLDIMLCKEALFILTTLSQIMEEKLMKPISNIRGWFNGRITVMLVKL